MSDTPLPAPDTPAPQMKKPRKPRQPKQNNKSKAEALINKDAAPEPLSSLFGGFLPDIRGQLEVEPDVNLPERFGVSLMPTIRNYSQIHFIFPSDENPTNTAYHLATSGLNLSTALKYLHSTPQSQLTDVSMFNQLMDTTVPAPSSYSQILSLLGKTDFGDTQVRVMNNATHVKNLFFKGLWHILRVPAIDYDYIYNGPLRPGLDRVKALRAADLEKIVYSDSSTLNKLHQHGRILLDDYLHRTVTAQLATEDDDGGGPVITNTAGEIIPNYVTRPVRICPPYLRRKSTVTDVVAWIQSIDDVAFAGLKTNLVLAGLLSIFEPSWLSNLTTPISTLDQRFAGVPFIATITPLAILHIGGLKSIYEFFDNNGQFLKAILFAIGIYRQQVELLYQIFDMKEVGKSTLGQPAQLVTVPESEMMDFVSPSFLPDDDGEPTAPPIQLVTPESSIVKSVRKLETPGAVLTAGAFRITKNVFAREMYRGFTTTSLYDIQNRVVRQSVLRGKKDQT